MSKLRGEQLRMNNFSIVPTIELMYSCVTCRLHKVKVSVPARINEDVGWWMKEVVTKRLDTDHSERSPYCPAEALSEVWIPHEGTDRVGGAPVQ